VKPRRVQAGGEAGVDGELAARAANRAGITQVKQSLESRRSHESRRTSAKRAAAATHQWRPSAKPHRHGTPGPQIQGRPRIPQRALGLVAF